MRECANRPSDPTLHPLQSGTRDYREAPLSKHRRPLHPARTDSPRSGYWADLPREHGFEPLRVEGEIPAHLRGTLYRAGPALTGRFGRPYEHVFEGDGAICAIRIGEGTATGAVRLLRGDAFLEEERAGRPLYYSAAPWPRRLLNNLRGRAKNTGNTNVLAWHGSLFALMENARPLAFDRELATIGESSLGGVVRGAFTAHPHDLPARRTTFAFGLRYGGRSSVALYALPWSGPARELCALPLPHPVMLHDFMATGDHLVLLVSPLRLVLHRAILALGPFTRLFQWHPEDGTEVIVVPIDEPARVRRFRVDPFFQIHFAGGFEDGDDTFVDVMAYADSSSLDRNVAEIERPPEVGVLTRVRIPRAGERIEKERLAKTPLEFGLVDPRFAGTRCRHVFGVTVDEERFGLAHVDLERGEEHRHWLPAGELAGEGIFVPEHPAAPEGHGHILSLVHRLSSNTAHLAVFDSRRLEQGPIARAHFDHHIPVGFHGTWVPTDPDIAGR